MSTAEHGSPPAAAEYSAPTSPKRFSKDLEKNDLAAGDGGSVKLACVDGRVSRAASPSSVLEKQAEAPPPVKPQPPSIPNGGLVAWCQVLGSFFLNFNSW